jgi:hypothetical protein
MPYLLTHSVIFTIILLVSGILQNRWHPNTFDISFALASAAIIALGTLLSAKKNLNGPVILLLASFVIMIRNAVGIALDFQFFPYMVVATFSISQIVSIVANMDHFKQIKN